MKEILEFVFSSGWTYVGTVFLIYSIGHALALPFLYYYRLKSQKLNKSVWKHPLN